MDFGITAWVAQDEGTNQNSLLAQFWDFTESSVRRNQLNNLSVLELYIYFYQKKIKKHLLIL